MWCVGVVKAFKLRSVVWLTIQQIRFIRIGWSLARGPLFISFSFASFWFFKLWLLSTILYFCTWVYHTKYESYLTNQLVSLHHNTSQRPMCSAGSPISNLIQYSVSAVRPRSRCYLGLSTCSFYWEQYRSQRVNFAQTTVCLFVTGADLTLSIHMAHVYVFMEDWMLGKCKTIFFVELNSFVYENHKRAIYLITSCAITKILNLM